MVAIHWPCTGTYCLHCSQIPVATLPIPVTMYPVSCPWRQFSAPVQLITGTLSTLSSSPVRGEKTYGFQTIKPPSAGTNAVAWRGYCFRSFCLSGQTPTLRPSGSHGRNSLIVKFDRCHKLFSCRHHNQYQGSKNYVEI
jgi:hypothetical protein